MAYDKWGEGKPLVLFCGLGCDGRMWGPVLDRLNGRFTAIVPRTWEAATIAEGADMAAEALNSEGFAHALLVGLSMGGYGVFEFLRRHPGVADGAVLLDTTALPDSPERRQKRLDVLALLAAGKFEQVLVVFARSVLRLGGPNLKVHEEALVSMARQLGPEVYARSVRAIMERRDYMDVLASTETPLLFLAGEEDLLTPPETAARMAAVARHAQAYQIPEAAHMSALENPGAVAFAMSEFFSKIEAGATAPSGRLLS